MTPVTVLLATLATAGEAVPTPRPCPGEATPPHPVTMQLITERGGQRYDSGGHAGKDVPHCNKMSLLWIEAVQAVRSHHHACPTSRLK